LFSIHTEIIQISIFLPIFKFPTVLDCKHPDMLLLTYLSIPICCHSFQTRQCWYCYHLNEFFIPAMYCYIVRIPETLLLTSHSFLADDRTVPNPSVLVLLPSYELFIPPMYCYIVRIPEILLLTPHSLLASDHAIDTVQPVLLLTGLFTTNQSSYFYSRFVYLHIFLGIWFPTS